MCMPYMGKLFGGGHRRRNNAVESPHSSQAPTPQQSNATIETTNTATITALKKDSVMPVNIDMTPQVCESVGSVKECEANNVPAEPEANKQDNQAKASGSRPSWWDYFGMNKNKKGSIDSL